MAQIAARALATLAVLKLLEAFFPGAGKLVAAAGAISVPTKHQGGIAGQGGPRRTVSPWVFAGAPRFHDGGLPGIRANEVPAILQMGEEVLTRNDPRHAANGGGGNRVRIINLIEPEHVQNAMSTTGGERVIINAIRANAGAVKQVLREF